MRNSRYAHIFSVIRVLRFLKDYQLSHSCRNPARRFSCILPCCHTSASYFLRSSCFPLAKQTSLEDTRNVSSTRLASSTLPLVLIFVSAQVHISGYDKVSEQLSVLRSEVRLNFRTNRRFIIYIHK